MLLARMFECFIAWNAFIEVHFQCPRIWIIFRAFDPYPYFAPEMLYKCMRVAVVRLSLAYSWVLLPGWMIREIMKICCCCYESITIQTDQWWSVPLTWPMRWTENRIFDFISDLKYLIKLNKLVWNDHELKITQRIRNIFIEQKIMLAKMGNYIYFI